MLTDAEIVVLERRLRGPAGMARAAVALLLDHNAEMARTELLAEEATLRRYFRRALPPQPGRFGFSPCDIATLAACDVLGHAPADRKLGELTIAFDPTVATVAWSGCGPRAVDPALALIAWLLGDEALSARHLVHCRPEGILDRLLTQVVSLLVRDRGDEVGGVLTGLGPEYAAAMGRGLWRSDPEAFLHVRLLAALQVGAERGCMDISTLPDTIPYAPIWFLNPNRA